MQTVLTTLPFDKTIGIIGGGQLGKMLIESSRPWNFKYNILENDPNCPAAHLAEKVIVGSLLDAEKIRELAANVDVITYEIEHINCEVLLALENEGKTIIPSPKALQIIQDKGLQKAFYVMHKIETAPFCLVKRVNDWPAALAIIKGDNVVVKSCKGGYDGKGVQICKRTELENGLYPFADACIVETFVPNVQEIAIIVARDTFGNIQLFPEVEMFFSPISNLVEFLFSPSRFSETILEKAQSLAKKVVAAFDTPGLFAVELFIDELDNVFVNETAPRPHNSGHHTIEACYTSQFEQLNRILASYPLGNTDLVKPGAMINITGSTAFSGTYQIEKVEDLLKEKGVFVHLYNKIESKPHRKLGHITVLGDTLEALIVKAENIKTALKIIPA